MLNIICYDLNGDPLRRFYQYDVGQKMVLKDLALSPTPVVELQSDTCVQPEVATVTVSGDDLIVTIADSLLESGYPLRGYIRDEDEGGEARTIGLIYIPVVQRIRPDPDPVESAETFAKESEAWAVGTSGGDPVPDTAPQYENNAKYYAKVAETQAAEATDAANEIKGMTANASTLPPGSSATAIWRNGTLSLGIPRATE